MVYCARRQPSRKDGLGIGTGFIYGVVADKDDPQGLKPRFFRALNGTAEAVPLRNPLPYPPKAICETGSSQDRGRCGANASRAGPGCDLGVYHATAAGQAAWHGFTEAILRETVEGLRTLDARPIGAKGHRSRSSRFRRRSIRRRRNGLRTRCCRERNWNACSG